MQQHPQIDEMRRIRAHIAELSRLRAFNLWMGTSLQSLDDIPIDTVEIVMAWASRE